MSGTPDTGPDAGFDTVMRKLDVIDGRLDEYIGAGVDASKAMVGPEEVWMWMFVVPTLAILAAMLAIAAASAGAFG